MLQNSSYDNSMPIQNIFFPSNVQNGLLDRMPGRDSPSLYNQFFCRFFTGKVPIKDKHSRVLNLENLDPDNFAYCVSKPHQSRENFEEALGYLPADTFLQINKNVVKSK